MKSLDKVWFTAKELEALKLNGLPSHATNITRKAKNENGEKDCKMVENWVLFCIKVNGGFVVFKPF